MWWIGPSRRRLMQGDAVLCIGTAPVNKHIPALLGFGLDVFDVACAANQGDIERLGNLRPAERKRHNIFMLDEAGELLEHLGGTEDYLLAAELYEVALRRWPEARIQMREGARIVYDNKRSVVV